MKNTKFYLLISLFLLTTLFSCINREDVNVEEYNQVSSVEVGVKDGAPASITKNGGTLELESEISTKNGKAATLNTLSWSSSDDFVATIDSDGKVTAHNNGKVDITVKVAKQPNASDSITVTVSNQTPNLIDVLKAMSLVTVKDEDGKSVKLLDKDFLTLLEKAGLAGSEQGKGYPLQSDIKYTIFVPTKKALAKNALLKDEDLLKKIVKYHIIEGAVKIDDFGSKKATLYDDKELLFATPLIVKTKATGGIEAKILKNLTIEESKTRIFRDLEVENGVVHIIDKLLIPEDLKVEYGALSVHPTGIEIQNKTTNTITTDKGKIELLAKVLPDNSAQKMKWSIVSGEEFATLKLNKTTKKYELTAVKDGKVKVRATTEFGSKATNKKWTDDFVVTISEQIYSDLLISQGESLTLTNKRQELTLTTNKAENEDITWSIAALGGGTADVYADFDVITAKVIAKENGTVVVTATSKNTEKTAKITIIIEGQTPPAFIKIEGDKILYRKGHKISLKASVLDKVATDDTASIKGIDQRVTWSSSDDTLAKVSDSGEVEATKAAGYDGAKTVTITAISKADTSVSETYDITLGGVE